MHPKPLPLPYPEFQIDIKANYEPDAKVVLYHGDTKDLIELIPAKSVQLIITSPPYNLGKEYEKETSIDKYLNTQREIIRGLHRVLRDDGSICWQVGNYVKDGEVFPLDIFYYSIFKELGMFLRNRIVWRFGHGLHASNRFSGRYETILWFTKTKDYVFNLDSVRIPSKYPGKRYHKGPRRGQISGNPKGKNPSDVWDILIQDWESGLWDIPNVKANHPEKTIHPCQFPIELVERCILALTNEGDWVFDPYAGVGSTLIAALKNNRRAMGSEKEEEYIGLSRQRIQDYNNGVLKIRPMGKPVYQPTGREKVSQIPEEWRGEADGVHEAYKDA